MGKKSKLINFAKSVSYSFSSNILSMLISVVVTLVIPKLISVEQYGYYQLYIFYTGYVGMSYFGWCDGMYLREGGQYYDKIDKPMHCTQFWLLGFFETAFYGILFVCALYVLNDDERYFVIACVCVAAVGMCLRWFITFLLQATARIKEYAIVTVTERILYVLVAVPLVLMGYRGFRLLVVTDVIAKYISLLIGVFFCRDMVFSKLLPIKGVLYEIWMNVSAGVKLMVASLCSMLVIGVIRFGVERRWDISTFSKVSLTLSLLNMVMAAISAIAVVIYPLLRRTTEQLMPKVYTIMRVILMSIILGGITLYYPARKILSIWLPQYEESLQYATITLPICIFESKMSLLVSTYYKALRREALLMMCNVATLALSVVCALVSILVLDSVIAALFSILIAILFRSVISETLLTRYIHICVAKDIFIEIMMAAAFIICNWFFGFAGMVVYAGCYAVYLFLKRQDITNALNFIKSM